MINSNTKTLGEVCKNASESFDFSKFDEVVFINTGDVLDGKFLHEEFSKKNGLPGQAKKAIKKNDILYSEIRPINRRFAFVHKDCDQYVVSTKFMVLRPIGDILPKYLYHYLKCNQTIKNLQKEAESRSGTFPQITFDSVSHFPITIPSLKYQEKVSLIIDNIEKKIELNKKMNQILEEIAKTVFKSWFIDFDPVRAKVEGRSTGLSKEISDLFPDSFEDSELGDIPKDWQIKSLDEIADFLNGLALQKYPECEDQPRYPVLKIAQLRLGSTNNQNIFSSSIPSNHIIKNGDYVFSWSASLLSRFWMGGNAALNQHLFKVTSQDYPSWFYAGWIEKHMKNFTAIALSKATSMGHIKRSDLKDAKTIVPPSHIIKKLGEYISPLRKRANLCIQENFIFSELRDTLLPKLISGELKITDAEKLIDEVNL